MRACINRTSEISLIPYLARGADAPVVGLSFASGGPSDADGPVPFTRLHDADPLTLIRPASFVTASGRELKRVFLLLQKDRYLLETNGLWPLTNTDIDTAWQKAFAGGGRDDADPASFLLPGQIGENGVPVPFSALLFCRSERAFFHPPCPLCGLPLSLCRDDELLLASALEPYSGSLKRYLYCVECSHRNMGVFYDRDPVGDDPPAIRDLHALIDDFGRLRSMDGVLPCARCVKRDDCYGIRGAAHSMIVPFSFYPFHLLIFDAMTLPARDFLSLVSGASIDELKSSHGAGNVSGRVRLLDDLRGVSGVSMFPADDDRYFLEVLYLKLSFLGDILRQLFTLPGTAGNPDMKIGLEKIWVKLPPLNGLLPSFWNFRAKMLDIVRPPDLAGFPGGATSPRFLQAGLLWFHVLLAKGSQSGGELIAALKEALSNNCRFKGTDGQFSTTLFSPEQIFWKPQGKRVNSCLAGFWEQSLAMGLDLLHAATSPVPAWSFKDFFTVFEELRGRIRAAMFDENPAANDKPAQEPVSTDDEAVRRALMRIIGKWRGMDGAAKPCNVPTEGEFDTMETVILPPAAAAAMILPLSGTEVPDRRAATVSPCEGGAYPPPEPDQRGDGSHEAVLTAGCAGRERQPDESREQEQGDVFATETVILTPGARHEVFSGATGAGTGAEALCGDALLETVVLGSRKSDAKVKKWRE